MFLLEIHFGNYRNMKFDNRKILVRSKSIEVIGKHYGFQCFQCIPILLLNSILYDFFFSSMDLDPFFLSINSFHSWYPISYV